MLSLASSLTQHHHGFQCRRRCTALRRSQACACWSMFWRSTIAGGVAGLTMIVFPLVVVQVILTLASGALWWILSLIVAPIAVGLTLFAVRLLMRGRLRRLLDDERVIRSVQLVTLSGVLLLDGLHAWRWVTALGAAFAIAGTLVGLLCGLVLAVWLSVVERREPSGSPDVLIERARLVALSTALVTAPVLLTVVFSPFVWIFVVPLAFVALGGGAAWAATPCIMAGVVSTRWPEARSRMR